MKKTSATERYYQSYHSLVNQLSELRGAEDALKTHLSGHHPRSAERHLLSSALANQVKCEEELYQRRLRENTEASRCLLQELFDANEEVGKEIAIELESGAYYRVLIVSHDRLVYV